LLCGRNNNGKFDAKSQKYIVHQQKYKENPPTCKNLFCKNGHKFSDFNSDLFFQGHHFGPFYYSQRYGILYIELLLVYSFNTFLSLILNVLLTQYQYLNHQLDEQMGSKVVFTQKLVHSLKDIEQSLCFLKDTIEIVNSAFGWPLVLSISFTILHILNKFHFMFIILLFPDEVVLQRIIADAVSVLLTFVSTDDGNSQFDIFFTVLYRHSDCLLRPGPQGSRRDVVEILQVEKKN
jgi:hypothetical protein